MQKNFKDNIRLDYIKAWSSGIAVSDLLKGSIEYSLMSPASGEPFITRLATISSSAPLF